MHGAILPGMTPTDTDTDTGAAVTGAIPSALSALELARNRAQSRHDTESFLEWALRAIDWHLSAEPDDEHARRLA
jgi:hypothetical protein